MWQIARFRLSGFFVFLSLTVIVEPVIRPQAAQPTLVFHSHLSALSTYIRL